MATRDITLPKKITWHRWASQMVLDLPDFQIPIPDKDPITWWGWADAVILNNNLNSIPLPDKKTYPSEKDWVTWAEFFINNVYI